MAIVSDQRPAELGCDALKTQFSEPPFNKVQLCFWTVNATVTKN